MYLRSNILVILSIAMHFCIVCAVSTDKLSLLEIKAKIDEDGPMGLLREWNESSHFCSWPGVTCGRRHRDRVTKLDLSDWHVKGQMSPHIGNLSFLRVLNLTKNSFSGQIPSEIGRLSKLRVLDFWWNKLGGEIPRNISGCSSLDILFLQNNNLVGKIPSEIGLLSDLRYLALGYNELVGKIPFSLGNLSRLIAISLSENTLSGTIPISLGRGLTNLKKLYIDFNSIEGEIPVSLYNISSLEDFIVQANKLEGSLPPDLGFSLPNLKSFLVDSNNFSGNIPATMSNASNLIEFQISSNNFTGNVPIFKSSPSLSWFSVGLNNLGYGAAGDLNFLRGTINNTSLELVTLAFNNFGGAIPENIGNATRLRILALGVNKISGSIPLGIGNLVSLELLSLERNNLIGQIPNTIGKLRTLNILSLWGNKLSGSIPTTIGNMTLLGKLSLQYNKIQGSIPKSIGGCTNLQELLINRNNLSGPIPSQLFSISSLSIGLDLADNRLSGSIPSEVGKLVNLGIFDVSRNELSGEIPESLGSCSSIEYLYLQGNVLQGLIPEDLRNMKGIQVLDLSQNDLSGKIPIYFSDLQGLRYLNLSFNKLEGPVPLLGVFKNARKFSIEGNTRLCGGLPELKLSICASSFHKNHTQSQKVIRFVIISCFVVGLSVVTIMAILIFIRIKRRKPTDEVDLSIGASLSRISYGDLLHATNSFSSSNLIGVGSFGSVYKGILNLENHVVAVKVLDLHVSRALKSFVVECESLGSIRHKNLLKLQNVCSSVDYQGNDFKALVYEFMENGNLEEWLNSDRAEQRLSLIQRIEIAIDVATALDYLHNQCSEAIVHCDIKPSNILLDGDMVARLGDFGLAKLIRSNVSLQSSSVGVIRGTVGYVPPEYATGVEVSTLGDIYSFGILLLEMITAKRPTDNMFKDDFDLNNFSSSAIHDSVTAIVDPMLLEEEQNRDEAVFKSSLVSIIEIGVACSSKHPAERRNMNDVAADLIKIKDRLARRVTRNRVYQRSEGN